MRQTNNALALSQVRAPREQMKFKKKAGFRRAVKLVMLFAMMAVCVYAPCPQDLNSVQDTSAHSPLASCMTGGPHTFFVPYGSRSWRVGFSNSKAGQIGDINNGYEYFNWLCSDTIDPSGTYATLPTVTPHSATCAGNFKNHYWKLDPLLCASGKTTTIKYSFSNGAGNNFEFYVLIYIDADKNNQVNVPDGAGGFKTLDQLMYKYACGEVKTQLDCSSWVLDSGQTWLNGATSCAAFGSGLYLQTDSFLKYKVGSNTYDTQTNLNDACGQHTIELSGGSNSSPFTLQPSGLLQLSGPWPSIANGGSVTINILIQVRLADTTVVHGQSIVFIATTPCDCDSLSLTTILDTSSKLTVLKELMPEIKFGTDILGPGELNHALACWGPEYELLLSGDAKQIFDVTNFKTNDPSTIEATAKTKSNATLATERTLTFQVRVAPTTADLKTQGSKKVFQQTYIVKSIMSTDYLEQPILRVIQPMVLVVGIQASGATMRHPAAYGNIQVEYRYKAPYDQTKPDVISPTPYTGWTGSNAQLTMHQSFSFGTTHLPTPEGDLVASNGEVLLQPGGQLSTPCDDWSFENMNTVQTKSSRKYINNVHSDFKGTFNYTCKYANSIASSFKTQPAAVQIKIGANYSFQLPPIIAGSRDLSKILVEPDPLIAEFLVIKNKGVCTVTIDCIKYNGSHEIIKLNGQQSSFPVKLTLVNTLDQKSIVYTIEVTLQCPIHPAIFDAIKSNLQQRTIAIEAESRKAVTETTSVSEIYQYIESTLGYNNDIKTKCGELTTSIQTVHTDFLTYNATTQLVALTSSANIQDATYQDSYYTVSFMNQTWQVPIRATFSSCKVTQLRFETPSFSLKYDIGSEPYYIKVPPVIQEPDCDKVFDTLEIKQIISANTAGDILAEAVSIDSKTNSIQVSTDDYRLANSEAEVQISVDQSLVTNAEDFTVYIDFAAPRPHFNLTEFKAKTIVCSELDKQWVMALPDIITEEISPVQVSLEPVGSYALNFTLQDNRLFISDQAAQDYQNGSCPLEQEIELSFELSSALLGRNYQTLLIPVRRYYTEIAFQGFDEDSIDKYEGETKQDNLTSSESKYEPNWQTKKLRVKKMRLRPDGLLTIFFNKLIKPLPIQPPETIEARQGKRKTSSTQKDFELTIQEAISLRIEEEDVELNKSIAQVEFIDQDSDSVAVQITFNDTNAISPEITYPDNLVMTINLPELFVDSETSESIDADSLTYKVPVGKQYTKSEYAKMVEMAETAVKIGVAVGIWEIILIILFKQVLFSMWVLILTLQFYVYIGTWQIRYPWMLTFLLRELKRIALGEFVDDLELGNKVRLFFSFEPLESYTAEEKVGQERLGPTDAFASIGPTLILVSVVFSLIILIVLILVFIGKKSKTSVKWQKRIENLKLKVFYNPIFRYFFLNSLKLNMAGMLGLKAAGEDSSLAMLPIALLTVITQIPLVLSFVVLYRRGYLDEQKTRKSIGSIYEGKDVDKDIHRVVLYPMMFFWRRTCFVIATVFLFEHPVLQMISHYVLSMLSATILVANNQTYVTQAQRIVEVGSEFLLHLSSIMLAQFTNPAYAQDKQQEVLQVMTLTTFSMLLFLNISYLVFNLVTSYNEKKRNKLWEQRRKAYEEKIEADRVAKQIIEQMKASLAEEQKQQQLLASQTKTEPRLDKLKAQNVSRIQNESGWKKVKAAKRKRRIQAKKLAREQKMYIVPGMNQQEQDNSLEERDLQINGSVNRKYSNQISLSSQAGHMRGKEINQSSLFISDPSLIDEDPSAAQYDFNGKKTLIDLNTVDPNVIRKVSSPSVDDLLFQFESLANKQVIDLQDQRTQAIPAPQLRHIDHNDIHTTQETVEAILKRRSKHR